MVRKNWNVVWCAFVVLAACASREERLVPANVVAACLSDYTLPEKNSIESDLNHIKGMQCEGKKASSHPLYVSTAGLVGAAKSGVLETYMAKNPELSCVYIDVDQTVLRFMASYQKSLSCYSVNQHGSYDAALKNAYKTWRQGAFYISHHLINHAYAKSFSIAHGTTSQSPQICELYQQLKNKGYKIVVLMCVDAPDSKNPMPEPYLGQPTPLAPSQQEKALWANLPVFVRYADTLHFYWVSKDNACVEVGTYAKGEGWKGNPPHQKHLAKIKAAYHSHKKADDITWDELMHA